MAPLTTREMDRIHKLKAESFTPMQIHEQLVKDRRRRRQQGPDLTTARRFVQWKTQKRATTETRGRKKKLSVANVKAMDRARDKLLTQADCERESSTRSTSGPGQPSVLIFTVTQPSTVLHQAGGIGVTVRS